MTVQIHWVPPVAGPSSRPLAIRQSTPATRLSPTKCVLQVSGNVAAQLSVAEILQLDCDSHLIVILSEPDCPSAVQTGESRGRQTFRQVMNSVIHNSS